MVQTVEKQIFLRDSDGGITPFDAGQLQTRLVGGFLATGLREESFMSEEIVLALEYTLLNSPRREPVFSRSEIDAAVIRLLENIGFPEVAHVFRRNGHEKLLRIATDPVTVAGLLSSHLGCSPERAAHIAELVSSALQKLELTSATPHLVLELSRHYERDLAENELPAGEEFLPGIPQQTLTRQEIYALLPPEPKELVDAGVLRINGITTLFPSVRFFFFMNDFARMKKLSYPVTELEIEPHLHNAGNALEQARQAISGALRHPGELPCCLTLPDIFDFLESCAGSTPDQKLAAELASVLTGALDCELYHLAFD
ncbi:MAG: hypothetical protein IKD23_01175 [Lentisphaeria bacterium]|nr:hypothetical protein [Lentisphaerota bacterium]MBR2624989.1 hypothetical protein [Lentisphaeria bacterium]